MIRRFLLAAVLLAAVLGAVPVAAAGFMKGIEDLPLMPGLVEHEAAGVSFPSQGGRIVEALASGPVARHEVLEFYGAALPELGWGAVGKTTFEREAEVLRIEVTPSEGAPGSTVRFSLSPAAR